MSSESPGLPSGPHDKAPKKKNAYQSKMYTHYYGSYGLGVTSPLLTAAYLKLLAASPTDSEECQAEYIGFESVAFGILTKFLRESSIPPSAGRRKISLPLDHRKGGPILLSAEAIELAKSQALAGAGCNLPPTPLPVQDEDESADLVPLEPEDDLPF